MATTGVDAVRLDPWHEPGIPLEEQYRSWKQRIKAPYDKQQVDAYTRTRMVEEADTILQGRTEIFPGRPTSEHHTDPEVRLLRQWGGEWLPKEELPADWPSHRYKEVVNADAIPSEEIVDLQLARQDPPERPGDELLARAREVALELRQ